MMNLLKIVRCEKWKKKKNISKVITASNLPPVIVKYILKDFLMDFEMIEQTVIKQQHSEYEQRLKENKKDKK